MVFALLKTLQVFISIRNSKLCLVATVIESVTFN